MTTPRCTRHRRGWTAISLLVTMACILVLVVIALNAVRGALGPVGQAPMANSVRSMEDKLNLYAMGQSMAVYANDHDGWNPVPHRIAQSDDRGLDTTANLFSAMVMQLRIAPDQLISGNERSGYVEVDDDYDFTAHDPSAGVFWDSRFEADLAFLSNTSFAHMPLYGQRFESGWRQARSPARLPLLGNRGPEGGQPDPDSWTCDPTGAWAGHLVFADAHVEFVDSFTPLAAGDNLFVMEEGPEGGDAMIAFTKQMGANGPVVEFD